MCPSTEGVKSVLKRQSTHASHKTRRQEGRSVNAEAMLQTRNAWVRLPHESKPRQDNRVPPLQTFRSSALYLLRRLHDRRTNFMCKMNRVENNPCIKRPIPKKFARASIACPQSRQPQEPALRHSLRRVFVLQPPGYYA